MADVESLSHSAICVHDLKEAEDFYCNVLGAHQLTRVNFKTEDAQRGRSVHGSVALEDYLLALMVPRDFMPMPPPEQQRGAHGFRHAFRAGQVIGPGPFAFLSRIHSDSPTFRGTRG